MTKSVPITVLMTVRNGEPYVEEAVRSILGQTFEDFRFLILDNASTDGTRQIIRGLRDSRIELIELDKDIGQTNALNRGLALIDSPYVARIDADDIAYPSRVERQMDFLVGNPEVALLGTWWELTDPQGRIMFRCSQPAEHTEIMKGMLFGNPFSHTTVVYRKQAVMACGGYDTTFRAAQDYDLWWRLALGHKVGNLPEYLMRVRIHPEQASRSFANEIPRELFQIVRRALEHPDFPKEIRRFARRARGYADLKYAAGISESGHICEAFVWLVRGVVRDPSLLWESGAGTNIGRAIQKWPGYGAVRRIRKFPLWNHPVDISC